MNELEPLGVVGLMFLSLLAAAVWRELVDWWWGR